MAFGKKTRRLIYGLFISFIFFSTAFSQTTYYSQTAGSGTFGTLSNWDINRGGGGGAPGDFVTGDIFVIQNGDVITLDNFTHAIQGLTIESGGTFNNSSNTLIFGSAPGLLDIQSGGTYTASSGTIEHNAGLLNVVTIQAAAATALNNVTTNGRLDFSGNIQFTLNGTFNYKAPQDISLNGTTTLVYGGSATLKYDFTGSKTIASEWPDGTSVPNVILTNGTVTIPTATTRTVSSKLTRDAGSITATGTLAYSATGSTLEYKPTIAANINVADEWPTTGAIPENVTINNTGFTVTSTPARTVPKTLTLTAGTISCGTNTLTVLGDVVSSDVAGSGAINNSTPLAMGDGTNSAENQTISGSITLNSLIINKETGADVVQLTGFLTFTGTTPALTVTQGIFDANGRTISGSYTLSVANGATFQTGGTSLSGASLSLAAGSTFNYSGTSELVIAGTYSNLTVSNNPTVGASLNGAVTVNGALTVNSGSRLNLANQTITKGASASLVVNGSLYTDGTDITGFNSYTLSSGTVRFNGEGTGSETAPSTTYSNFRTNNSAGVVIGTGGATVTGTLTFTNGKITSATGSLLTLAEGATATATSTSFVTGPVVRQTNGTGTSFVFPIGNGNNLRAVTLNFASDPSGGSETITAEANGTISSPTSTDPDIVSIEDDGSWTITTTTTTNNNSYSGTFTTNGFSPAVTAISVLTMVKGTSPAFNTEGTSPSTGTDFVTASFADGFSDFAVANLAAVFTWDAEGGNDNWTLASNWVSNSVPTTGSVVVINGAFTVDYNNSVSTTTYTSITLSGGATLNLNAANIDLSATQIVVGGSDALIFNGTTIDAYSSSSTTYSAGSLVQYNDGSVQADDYANLAIVGATGGSGTANVSEDISVSSGSSFGGTIVLNGSASQEISSDGTATFQGLTFNNSNGFTVIDPVTVNGTLTLTSGIVENGSTLITVASGGSISGGSATAYISGPLAIAGATGSKTFPIGDGVYRPVVTNLTGSTPTVQFEAFDAAPNFSFTGGLATISTVRYFRGQITSGSISGGNVTLSYGSDDGVSEFNESGDVVVARSSDNSTNPYASLGGQTSGTAPDGSVTSTVALGTSLDYFTLGTITGDNSLPVELAAFSATPDFDKVVFQWQTASESENLGFNFYRRLASEENWNQINAEIIPGQGNYSGETDYEFIDDKINAGETYSYKMESVSYTGAINVEKVVEIVVPIPTEYVLFNNFPNPFNPTTHIKFQLPENSLVTLSVYDISGKLVKTLLQESNFDAGQHTVTWDATNEYGGKVSSGMYLYRFNSGNFNKLGRMLLLK